MDKIRITQVRSIIDVPKKQKLTIQALGLKHVNHSVVKNATPQILGMIKKVQHLVKVEKVEN